MSEIIQVYDSMSFMMSFHLREYNTFSALKKKKIDNVINTALHSHAALVAVSHGNELFL